MRIGILTHHYVKNYGAFLQMKGMYETLQRLYPEAEVTVINYVNQKHWRRNIIHILHFRPGVDTLSTYVEKIRQLRTFTKYERSILHQEGAAHCLSALAGAFSLPVEKAEKLSASF